MWEGGTITQHRRDRCKCDVNSTAVWSSARWMSRPIYVPVTCVSRPAHTLHGIPLGGSVSSRTGFRTRVVLFLLLLLPPAAHAQFETASVVGTVRDSSGAVVPDAKVTLTNTATGVSLTRTTTGEGNYEFVTVK